MVPGEFCVVVEEEGKNIGKAKNNYIHDCCIDIREKNWLGILLQQSILKLFATFL